MLGNCVCSVIGLTTSVDRLRRRAAHSREKETETLGLDRDSSSEWLHSRESLLIRVFISGEDTDLRVPSVSAVVVFSLRLYELRSSVSM